jgi:hypothetical protein
MLHYIYICNAVLYCVFFLLYLTYPSILFYHLFYLLLLSSSFTSSNSLRSSLLFFPLFHSFLSSPHLCYSFTFFFFQHQFSHVSTPLHQLLSFHSASLISLLSHLLLLSLLSPTSLPAHPTPLYFSLLSLHSTLFLTTSPHHSGSVSSSVDNRSSNTPYLSPLLSRSQSIMGLTGSNPLPRFYAAGTYAYMHVHIDVHLMGEYVCMCVIHTHAYTNTFIHTYQ